MKHLQNEVTKLVEQWKKEGFDGILFEECYMEPCQLEDFISDGNTKEEYEEWIKNYAIFVVNPDFDEFSGDYISVNIDMFYDSLLGYIFTVMEEDPSNFNVTHYTGCYEIEIERKCHI